MKTGDNAVVNEEILPGIGEHQEMYCLFNPITLESRVFAEMTLECSVQLNGLREDYSSWIRCGIA